MPFYTSLINNGDFSLFRSKDVKIHLNVHAKSDLCLGTRDRPIIGFTNLFNRYRYRLIGIDTHHIGIGKIGIGIGRVLELDYPYRYRSNLWAFADLFCR